jgi:hypothetical protein
MMQKCIHFEIGENPGMRGLMDAPAEPAANAFVEIQ